MDELAQNLGAKIESLEQKLGSLGSPPPTGDPKKRGEVNSEDYKAAETTTLVKGLMEKIERLESESKAQREVEQQRMVSQRVAKDMAELGMEQPEAALLLMRTELGIDFIAHPGDPNQLLAVSASDRSRPYRGESLTARDVIREWSNTTTGKRFLAIPQSAKPGSGFSGGTPSAAHNMPESETDSITAQMKRDGWF